MALLPERGGAASEERLHPRGAPTSERLRPPVLDFGVIVVEQRLEFTLDAGAEFHVAVQDATGHDVEGMAQPRLDVAGVWRVWVDGVEVPRRDRLGEKSGLLGGGGVQGRRVGGVGGRHGRGSGRDAY